MFRFNRRRRYESSDLISSSLYDENSFYKAFMNDLKQAHVDVIIESPFITTKRIDELMPQITNLIKRGVKVYVNTRDPIEHDYVYQLQAEAAVGALQSLGVTVLYTVGHHRKLAVIDRQIIWEGSLNILSQNRSSEIMRRIVSEQLTQQLIHFLHLNQRPWTII